MPTRSFFLVALAAGTMATGCHTATMGQVPTVTRRDTSTASARTRPLTNQVRPKTVRSKRTPNILVATDNSQCSVDEDTFRDTKAGDSVTCAWSGTTS